MGHCLSCFKNRTNVDVATSPQEHKDEMTEIVNSNQVSTAMIPEFPQDEPLLHNNENNINCHRNNSHNIAVHTNNSVSNHRSGDTLQKIQVNEKAPKLFYPKLPSIPRSMSSITSSDGRISESRIIQLFEQYKDALEESILAEGIENLCNDLQLDPDDFKVLVLAWKLNASQMCRFTKIEFVQGLKNMKTDSLKAIQQRLNDISNELKRDTEQFKDLYRFTFKFGLDVSSGQRILPADIAILLWRLVFTNNEPPILDRWLSYLEKNPHIRGIPKDTWYMYLNFCEYVGDDLSSYDDTEAWPSLFDDFVEYENDQMNQNVTKNDIKLQD